MNRKEGLIYSTSFLFERKEAKVQGTQPSLKMISPLVP
jgi:hypothetical protein